MIESGGQLGHHAAQRATRYVSVVIPAYNEEHRIGSTLKRIHKYLTSQGLSFEIIVVSDGSTDGTEFLVARLSRELRGLALLHYKLNRGKGYAVKQGVLAASGRFIVVTDADLSTPIEESVKLLSSCERGVDIAFGSRALPGSEITVSQSFIRRVMGRGFNLIVQALALPGVKDTQCGFKCLGAAAARDLFSSQVTDGFAFDVELLMRAKRQGYRIQEVPIKWFDAPASTVRPFSDAFKMFRDVLRVRKLFK
ncbi:MAG: glycosyltransferase family 2 protein [Chloroflexi bacterium]|nr:glycosyltransferase family 2 protein [Chloroflexota bacterium]